MSKYRLLCRIKPYIQPFERELAIRELTVMAQAQPVSHLEDISFEPLIYEVVTQVKPEQLLNSLAYWESVTNGHVSFTAQVLREATVNVVRNGTANINLVEQLLVEGEVTLPKRRSLRYGPHGIHEYRGKYFPQLVKSLSNIAGLSQGNLIFDPMCGSGTTAVEGILLNCDVQGLDMNPLSVLMSRTKCGILSVNPAHLLETYEVLRETVNRLSYQRTKQTLCWFRKLSHEDQAYLHRWFAPEVLVSLDAIMQQIQQVSPGVIRDFFTLVLSNILRGVSWQKLDDLRVRKDVQPVDYYDPFRDFLAELDRSTKVVLAFLYNEGPLDRSRWHIQEGDARQASHYLKTMTGSIDAIITSPPYAMALPYLDTDRLSLSYLGLLPRPKHRKRDLEMIGNREVTESQRRAYWEMYEYNKANLPLAVQNLVKRVHDLNQTTQVGFRRRNVPALLAKYFTDMQAVLQEMSVLLRKGASAFVVVGNNHTIAGGQRVDIDTAYLLGELGETVGLRLEENLPMDMLVSRDIHRKNTVASESILFFRR